MHASQSSGGAVLRYGRLDVVGGVDGSDALAREAVAITQRTDALNIQGDAFYELAQVLHAAGRRNEAAVTLGQALKRYARKNLAQAGQVRKRLAEFQDAASR